MSRYRPQHFCPTGRPHTSVNLPGAAGCNRGGRGAPTQAPCPMRERGVRQRTREFLKPDQAITQYRRSHRERTVLPSSEAIKRGDAVALDRRFTGPPRSIRKLALKVSAIGLNREGFQMRRFILVASAIVGMLTIVPLATPAQAQQNQWCSKFKGMVSCKYSTEDQCRASRSGRGGTCFPRQDSR